MGITRTTRSGITAEAGAGHAPPADQLDAAVVVFTLGGRSLGLFASRVEEVQPAAEVKDLPAGPAALEGVVDLHGEIVPVIDGRRLLGLPSRPTELTDLFVIVKSPTRKMVVHVDAAVGLINVPVGKIAAAAPSAPDSLRTVGIACMDDGLLMVHDTEAFLPDHELSQAG